jgi:hypothetical protein
VRTLARHVGLSGSCSASRMSLARVSGLGKLKIRRARGGVVAVREVGLGAAGLEDERQPPSIGDRPQLGLGWQAGGVHRGLPLDAGEGRALGLGLDDADDLLVDVEQVVGAAVARPS